MITQATEERLKGVRGMILTKMITCSSTSYEKSVGMLQVTKCWAGGSGEKNHKGIAARQSLLIPGMHSILTAALLKTTHMHNTEQGAKLCMTPAG